MVDAFGRHAHIDCSRKSFEAEWGEGLWNEKKIFLIKPQSFMNCSGDVVKAFSSFYKILPHEMLVVHDELDIPLGELRFVVGRGEGGHNGVKSLVETLGEKSFYRLRAGVGRPKTGVDPADYVLSPFETLERPVAEEMIQKSVLAIEMFLNYGLGRVQQQYHTS